MNPMGRVIFYNDTDDFGGHEVMMLQAIKALTSKPDLSVIVMYFEKNRRMQEHLEALQPGLQLIPLSFCSRSFQSARSLLFRRHAREVAGLFRDLGPQLVIVVQGYIGISSTGLIAGKMAGHKVVTYLSSSQQMRNIGVRFGWLRDIVDRYLYTLPDGFITVNDLMKQNLIRRGISGNKIAVVRTGVDVDSSLQIGRSEARNRLGIPHGKFAIGIVGRINFFTKGHDLLLKVFSCRAEDVADIVICVIGDGRDKSRLLEIIRRNGLDDKVVMIPWMDNLSAIYPALDAVALPSRSESTVALVLLQAMAAGIPVIASKLEELSGFVPTQWLFDRNNPESILASVNAVRRDCTPELLEQQREVVKKDFNLNDFGKRFYDAVSPQIVC